MSIQIPQPPSSLPSVASGEAALSACPTDEDDERASAKEYGK